MKPSQQLLATTVGCLALCTSGSLASAHEGKASLAPQAQTQMAGQEPPPPCDDATNSLDQDSGTAEDASVDTYAIEMTHCNANVIDLHLSDRDLEFSGPLHRTDGNIFAGSDQGVQVIYDGDTGRVIVWREAVNETAREYVYLPVTAIENTKPCPRDESRRSPRIIP